MMRRMFIVAATVSATLLLGACSSAQDRPANPNGVKVVLDNDGDSSPGIRDFSARNGTANVILEVESYRTNVSSDQVVRLVLVAGTSTAQQANIPTFKLKSGSGKYEAERTFVLPPGQYAVMLNNHNTGYIIRVVDPAAATPAPAISSSVPLR